MTEVNIKTLTVKELHALAAEHKITIKGTSTTKSKIVDDLAAGGITAEQVRGALVKAGHIEADADENSTPDAAEKTPPTSTPEPKGPPKNAAGEVDLDEWEPAESDLEFVHAKDQPEQAELTVENLPKLEKAGAKIRKIVKTADHGQGRETWWCPWTDASRLTPDEPGYLDKIDASGAIRVGDYAVVLPPGGITKSQLERA